ncbi:MAG: DNA topoisomerase (ATP-hydrolyzing) subunit A [Eubacteriales bacterium]|nr:DNA topoisomerase (ATP-hydrolyzing) subunit A [Eubacteriales bacterium]
MARRKTVQKEEEKPAEIEIREISEVIETNYMPYTMSVIVARAIPEIDGFKPSHRKLLYTMYKMGLLSGQKTKSANVVGSTMKLNPHGDMAIYETLVRLTTGKEALLHPFIESKGSFGKHYSDMAFAAARYTEVKLDKICEYIFGGIDRDAVDFADNYDHTATEPMLLPTAFPNILVSPNSGIAVGLSSTICSFNLAEVCDVTSLFLKNGGITDDELLENLKAPDFSTGATLFYNREKMLDIYKTGRGSFKLRSKYRYDKEYNCIEVTEIPYTTTSEKIKDSITRLVKEGKIKDISDIRDETDISGLKIAIDLKRGTDPDKLMVRLFKSTPLEDSFGCNFNVLIGSVPKTLGAVEIIEEWCAFRIECLRRNFVFDWTKKKDRLHLLEGLKKILLDIDKAIRIIRHTENDREVVPNLMKGFDIDEIQADFIANIKLRNLNKEYILDNIDEIDGLENEIKELYALIDSDAKIKKYIIKELDGIKTRYAKPRKTVIISEEKAESIDEERVEHEDYPVTVFLSKEGYFKKCTAASLRGNDVQKFKENDCLLSSQETANCAEVLFFTGAAQLYKAHVYDFDDTKASALGDYIPAKLSFDPNEKVVAAWCLTDFNCDFALFFENGKAVRLPASVYETKTNRRKLKNAFFDKSTLINALIAKDKDEFLMRADGGKALIVKAKQLCAKSTRTSYGAAVMTLKKGQRVIYTDYYDKTNAPLLKESRYRKTNLPSAGGLFEDEDPTVLQQTIE